jgi:predicted ATPase
MTVSELVGRAAELAELGALIGRGRLVTVTGPGGVGKTSLVRALVGATTGPVRTVFADLSAVEDGDGVRPAVASALGVFRLESIGPELMADGSVMIVDNCEHVLDAAAHAVTELRALLPAVSICVTSRIPLGLRDEHVLSLRPLGVPVNDVVDAHAPAVELFLAVAARAGGTVNDTDLLHVCELCRRIDGMPLAIEILATRTRSMSVREILDRLGDRLDTVGQGGFRRDDRQRTVRDTVEWSYRLLSPSTRRMFDRLGVFAGPFSSAMAHAVAADGSSADTADGLDALVAASLLVASPDAVGTTWYHQLHAVRVCARDHLDADDELVPASERFVDHMIAEARLLAVDAKDGWRPGTFVSIIAMIDSFLHALRWTVERDSDPSRAFELLTVLWGQQSRTDEVLTIGRRALDRWPDVHHDRWADAAATVATSSMIIGRLDDADRLIDRALPVADRSAFAPVVLRRVRAQILRIRGQLDDAIGWFADAADRARQLQLTALEVDADLLRAAALAARGDVDAALSITRQTRSSLPAGDVAELLAIFVESGVLVQTDPAEAATLAAHGRALAESGQYPAAVVALGRLEAIGLTLTERLGPAAVCFQRTTEAMLRSATVSQYGSVLEAAALIAHRAGRHEWVDLARTAEVAPSVGNRLLITSDRILPPLPPSVGSAHTLADGFVLADRVLAELSEVPDPVEPHDHLTEPVGDAGKTSVLPGADVAGSSNRWCRCGDHWDISFDGRVASVRHSKGLDDLAVLLSTPDVEVPAIDLIGAAVASGDLGEVIDASARRRYEDRIRELQGDLVEAEDANDLGRAEMISAELDALVDHLTSAVGIGRRTRRTGATSERARTAVTRRIRTAIAHVLDAHPALGRHLDTSIRTGTYCCYRPDRATAWEIDA